MRIAICDDIVEYRLSIKSYVNEYSKIHNIESEIYIFNNGKSLLESTLTLDVLFLDIELGDLNGIDVAKEIQKKHSNTIILIITSYRQYLDAAMDIKVTRYIDKPISQNQIYSAMDKAISEMNETIITLHMKNNQIMRIKQLDIIYVEAKLKGVYVYCLNEQYCVKETLKQLRSILVASCFAVPHNSFIVNLNYVKFFKRNEICLSNPYSNVKISIASRKQPEFKRKFLDFIEEDIVND